MRAQVGGVPWWAALAVWAVVNALNLLQATGFLTRLLSGNRDLNHLLGYVMFALAIPAAFALSAFLRVRADWLHWAGPVVYLVFLALMFVVDYFRPVEFRSPVRPFILIPYLLLFFGAILLMGLPMFQLSRPHWLVTVATTVLLLFSMTAAMRAGAG